MARREEVAHMHSCIHAVAMWRSQPLQDCKTAFALPCMFCIALHCMHNHALPIRRHYQGLLTHSSPAKRQAIAKSEFAWPKAKPRQSSHMTDSMADRGWSKGGTLRHDLKLALQEARFIHAVATGAVHTCAVAINKSGARIKGAVTTAPSARTSVLCKHALWQLTSAVRASKVR